VAAGGSDDDENLVYACTACNRFKGEYAPAPGASETLRLLHPKRDNPEAHIVETAQGRLSGLTARGWLHIQRLHLNRVQLVEMRGLRRMERTLRDELAQAQEAEDRLRWETRRFVLRLPGFARPSSSFVAHDMYLHCLREPSPTPNVPGGTLAPGRPRQPARADSPHGRRLPGSHSVHVRALRAPASRKDVRRDLPDRRLPDRTPTCCLGSSRP
jgi:hypothetical protein